MLMLTFLAAAAAAAPPLPPVRVDPPLDRREIRQALTERMGQRQLDMLIAGIVDDGAVDGGVDGGRPQQQAARAPDARLAYTLR